MERGNKKKTARPDSSRHRATDIVTYSFLHDTEKRSEALKAAEDFKVCRSLGFITLAAHEHTHTHTRTQFFCTHVLLGLSLWSLYGIKATS